MEKLELRRANRNDAKMLFEWRNDPSTRTNSLQSAPLEWEKHLNWLAACLDNPNRMLYIAEMNHVPCGTVRADKIGSEYELSWTVAPAERGKGIGQRLVAALIATLPPDAYYQAVVLTENAASHKIAQRLGMEIIEVDNEVVTYQGRKKSS